MKIVSWNVNGLRSVWQKGFPQFVSTYKPDVICLQETKAWNGDIVHIINALEDYDYLAAEASKKGYSGVACLTKKGLNLSQIRYKLIEGKNQQAEFETEGRFVILKVGEIELYNIYFPSGTSGEERQNFKYRFLDYVYSYFKKMPQKQFKRIVVCGDFNICHKAIDIHHPVEAEKRQLSGFLPDERKWMDKFCELGFVDSFRHINADIEKAYSWWSYRAAARQKNLGWRIDYLFTTTDLCPIIKKASILQEVGGSDHCPVVLELANMK